MNPENPNSNNKQEQNEIIHGVQFEKREKPGGEIEYRSSALDRKIIILEIDSLAVPPEEGISYDVKIVKDTKPSDLMKGKFIAILVGEEGVPMDDKEEEPDILKAIEVDEVNKKVFVLETELPLNTREGGLVPNKENFKHFTLDKKTLETIDKVATAVELKQPCLLEGETSTSKTSSIEYLAMATGNEVERINLNGQTDTSELVGKFVPNDGQLEIEFEKVLKNPELLNNKSAEILIRANTEGRSLTLIESQKIAKFESIEIPDWRWQDGIIPKAMKAGQWVILDEINLAEPQILERINSALETNPSMTLSENGGVKIGDNGDFETHEDFRIFATMNPADYEGRAPMSPAFKDRWTSYKYVMEPGKEEYEAMMNLMIYGEQPDVEINGIKYGGDMVEPKYEKLEHVPGMKSLIVKVAKVQTILEKLAKNRDIGRDKKEKYIFTRRGLIEFVKFLEEKIILNRRTGERKDILNDPKEVVLRSLQHCYFDKISSPEDLKKVNDQLDAIGISRSKWLHVFRTPGGGGMA